VRIAAATYLGHHHLVTTELLTPLILASPETVNRAQNSVNEPIAILRQSKKREINLSISLFGFLGNKTLGYATFWVIP